MSDIAERLRSGYETCGVHACRDKTAKAGCLCAIGADEIERLRQACTKMNDEVCQILGKALGYPWYKDSPDIFPGATEASGVCVGDHVAESIAAEAAHYIQKLEEMVGDVA